MSYGLYISAEGAQAQSRRVEIIANNLANVDTIGFKRELAICQSRYAEAIEQGTGSPNSGSINDIGGGITIRQIKTDFSPGPVKKTGNPSDLSIKGDGYFLVREGKETMLTRAGNFRLTSTGELVTQQGFSVLSDTGSPIVISSSNGPWAISESGVLSQADGSTQNLAIVKPASQNDLTKKGENLFRSANQPEPVPSTQRRLASGYLELSAVQPTLEMTAMIEASRLMEANVNMMKAQDQMLAGLINRVLKA
jgi:flagellar basal-body rod protein FlgF